MLDDFDDLFSECVFFQKKINNPFWGLTVFPRKSDTFHWTQNKNTHFTDENRGTQFSPESVPLTIIILLEQLTKKQEEEDEEQEKGEEEGRRRRKKEEEEGRTKKEEEGRRGQREEGRRKKKEEEGRRRRRRKKRSSATGGVLHVTATTTGGIRTESWSCRTARTAVMQRFPEPTCTSHQGWAAHHSVIQAGWHVVNCSHSAWASWCAAAKTWSHGAFVSKTHFCQNNKAGCFFFF